MHKKYFWFFLTLLLAGFAAAAGGQTSTRFVVKMPEVLMLRINGQTGGQVPLLVKGGKVAPGSLHVEVVANCGWRLTVRATPLIGPIVLPPERLRLAGRPLAEYEQVVSLGKGPAKLVLPLTVDFEPGEPLGSYKSLLTFELYKL